MRGMKNFADGSKDRNERVFWYNYDKLYQKCLSMFKWKNLPPEIDERYLEMTLINQGYICFFKDEELNIYMALQCSAGGRFNIYNIPTRYQIFTPNGYHTVRTIKDSVLIYANLEHKPVVPILTYNAYKIADIERTIEVNLVNLKRPYVILVPENKKTTIKALFNKIKENEELIIGDDSLDLSNFSIQSMITPNNTLELHTLKTRYYKEALSDLGISNFSSDKKERVLTDEIVSNQEEVSLSRDSMLKARKEACKKINEMFGLNIDVEYQEDFIRDNDISENIKEDIENE